MGSFVATSMITTLLMVTIVGAVLVFVIVRLTKANSGGGGTDIGARADPVPGTMLVTAASMPSRNAVFHISRITGVVSAEGVQPTAVQYSGLIRTALWPSPGRQLPVILDRADPRKFAIQWDQVGTSQASALGQAEALAAAMRAKQDGDDA
jgi:preprotein translocase subunit SecG